MRKTLSLLLSSTAMVALATMPTLAQSSQTQPQTQQTVDQNRSKEQTVAAAEFVRKAGIGNLFEIRSGQLVASRSENASIKEYAQNLIADHRKMGQDLGAAAGAGMLPTQIDQQHQQMLSRLEQATGGQFDRRFIRTQIRAHQEAVSLYRSFVDQDERSTDSGRRTQNATLHQYAAKYLPILQGHLQTARDLREDLRQQSNRTTTRQNQQLDEQGQRGARTWTIEQRPPQVTVRRQQPDVNIQQQQPRITIRQAPPTVTIDQSPPEITVQMPRPDVNVTSPRPQVSVNVPQPNVRFNDQNVQPRVKIEQPGAEGEHEFQRARPQVDYQRTGEPKVVYGQQNRQPKVQYLAADGSRVDPAPQGRDQQATQSQRNPDARNSGSRSNQGDWMREAQRMTEDDDTQETTGFREAEQNTGNRAAQQTEGASDPSSQVHFTVEQLTDMDVYNGRGQNLGSIDEVIADRTTNRTYIVLAHGGFLGMFEDEVALPVNRLQHRGNRLVVRGLTEQEISDMPWWQERIPNYRSLDDSRVVQVSR